MALWNSNVNWSASILWGPSALPSGPSNANSKKNNTPMKRDNYYPRLVAERPEWHANFAAKILIYGPILGLTPAQVNQGVADNLYLAYGLGDWISNVRDFAPACTSSLETLTIGTGNEAYVFKPYTAPDLPTLPVGITVTPGALTRTFGLVQVIKGLSPYTQDMGIDMGIVGPEAPPPPPPGDAPVPQLIVSAIPGDENEVGRVKYFKYGHEYVMLESRRGGGAWEHLAQSAKSPFLDTRPLLVAGQAEVREYRGRYYDKGANSSGWSDVAKVTVGP